MYRILFIDSIQKVSEIIHTICYVILIKALNFAQGSSFQNTTFVVE